MRFLKKIRQFDVFREVHSEFTQTTTSGAVVSIICVAVMSLLIFSEFVSFLSVKTSSSMFVGTPDKLRDDDEKLRININIDFFNVECSLLSLDAQDVMGSHHVDVTNTISKKATSKNSCNISGHILVNRVPGNFHISTHSKLSELRKILNSGTSLNLSHRINHLSFGIPLSVRDRKVAYNPIDSLTRKSDKIYSNQLAIHPGMTLRHGGSYEYYLKVVPTIHKKIDGHVTNSFQFSSAYKHFGDDKFPACYFRYELSPITVEFTETRDSLTRFFVTLLGITGGMFTGFSLLSTWLNLSIAKIVKKANENKLG